MSDQVLWTTELQDEPGGPWRPMSSEGNPDLCIYAWRSRDDAEAMAAGFPRARVRYLRGEHA